MAEEVKQMIAPKESDKQDVEIPAKRPLEDACEPPSKRPKLKVQLRQNASKKKKVAFLLQYSGKKYRGSAFQKDYNFNDTVEKELLLAIVKAGGFQNQANVDHVLDGNLKKISFQRTSRTDKGVSAALAVFSVKMCIVGTIEEMKSNISELLPNDIRVLDIHKTLGSFDSHKCCEGREYEYLCPSFVFDQSADLDALDKFRLSEDKIELIKELFNLYSSGTRNYWNFTTKVSYGDPKAKRHMKSFEISKVYEVDGVQWIRFTLHGQSFMKNQIRKMIGLIVMILRDRWDKQKFLKSFTVERMIIPMVPAEGLILIAPTFDGYNKKCEKIKQRQQALNMEKYRKQSVPFKEESIYGVIYKETDAWKKWINFADGFDGDKYLGSNERNGPKKNDDDNAEAI